MGVMDKPVENAIGQRRIADLPPLCVLAVKDDRGTVTLFNDNIVMGSIAMTSVLIEKQHVIGTCRVVTTNL
jgi:hypothetical protein